MAPNSLIKQSSIYSTWLRTPDELCVGTDSGIAPYTTILHGREVEIQHGEYVILTCERCERPFGTLTDWIYSAERMDELSESCNICTIQPAATDFI